MGNRHIRRGHTELYESAHLLDVLAINEHFRPKARDLAGDLRRVVGTIEQGDGLHSTLSTQQSSPRLLCTQSHRTDQAYPCYYNPPLSLCFWLSVHRD